MRNRVIKEILDHSGDVSSWLVSLLANCVGLEKLFHHLGHCGAFFRTIATSLGTGSHLLVVREFFACGSTSITALGTAFTSMSAEITLPSTK